MTPRRNRHFGVLLCGLVALFTAPNAMSGEDQRTRIEVDETVVEYPNDSDFLVLKLDVSDVLSRVRVFGDGRVALLKYRNGEGWQPHELQVEPQLVKRLITDLATGGVLVFDPEAVRAKLRNNSGRTFPISSHPTRATLTVRLSKYESPYSAIVSDFSHSASMTEWDFYLRQRDSYGDVPELLALAGAVQGLLALENRPGLHPIVEQASDSSSLPSWGIAAGALESTPRILYFEIQPSGLSSVNWFGEDHRKLSAVDIDVTFDQPPSISPDHRFVAWRGAGGLHLVDMKSGDSRKFVESAKHSHSALWSPAGDQVALSAEIGERRFHLFSVEPDGSNPRALSDVGAKPIQWTTDGQRLYYAATMDRPRRSDVYLISRKDSKKRLVLTNANGAFRVSPDGRMAAYLGCPGPPGLKPGSWLCTNVVDKATGAVVPQVEPTHLAQNVFGFDWSPDSSSLVFIGDRTLGVASADGEDLTILVDINVGDQALAHANWSPQGTAIAFVKVAATDYSTGRSDPEIWIIGCDGSDPQPVAKGLYPHWVSETTAPAWVPW